MSKIKQSILWWCFEDTDLSEEEFVRSVAEAGYSGIEVFEEERFQIVKDHGLDVIAIQAHYPLEAGLVRREDADHLHTLMQQQIAVAEKWNIPNLIAFSGNRNGLDDAEGAEIAAEALTRIAPIAESAGVTLVLETLNSKVDHPDYMGDTTKWCVDVVKAVDSPAVKILYDIYHMQIMEGDLIRTIRENIDYIGHIHTAGNPGRNEINDSQEINYPGVMRAILDAGYDRYVGQEFIPLGDAAASIRDAYQICDV